MVAFNAKNQKILNKNLGNSLPGKTKNDLLLHEDQLGGLRWLSKRPSWENNGRRGRQS